MICCGVTVCAVRCHVATFESTECFVICLLYMVAPPYPVISVLSASVI